MSHHRFIASEEHLKHHDIVKCTLSDEDFPETSQKLLKERDVFLNELEENAYFQIPDMEAPYNVKFGLYGNKLSVAASDQNGAEKINIFSLMPYHSLLAEYHDIKVMYQEIITGLSSMQLETIDMARRGYIMKPLRLLQSGFQGK